MTSTAIATLAEVSNKAQTVELSAATRKQIAAYIAAGTTLSSNETFYVSMIERFPALCVQELITKIDPKADKKARMIHTIKINRMLLRTAEGRRLTTSGLVALAPIGRPYWHLFMQRIIGAEATKAIVPVRSAAVQKPRIAFPKDIAPNLRNDARENILDWCEIAGIGRRWQSQATVQSVQQGVRAALNQVNRENNLAIALSQAISATTGPLIVSMVRDAVAQQMLTVSSPVANRAAA